MPASNKRFLAKVSRLLIKLSACVDRRIEVLTLLAQSGASDWKEAWKYTSDKKTGNSYFHDWLHTRLFLYINAADKKKLGIPEHTSYGRSLWQGRIPKWLPEVLDKISRARRYFV